MAIPSRKRKHKASFFLRPQLILGRMNMLLKTSSDSCRAGQAARPLTEKAIRQCSEIKDEVRRERVYISHLKPRPR